MSSTELTPSALASASTHAPIAAALQARLGGAVYTPGTDGHAPESAAFNTAIIHSAPIVAAVASSADLVETVRVARQHGLRLHVQTTGHGASSPIADGILISTRALQGVAVDPQARIATIAGGSRWAPVIAAAAEHGLAPIIGSSPHVGAVGYILGGGLGPLARSHGFSSDYLVSLTVVTGTGELLEVDAAHHPELFWALRGGKVGLGIVTSLRLRLVELPTLYGGFLCYDEPHIETALRAWVDWTATADPQLTTSVAIVRFPPLDVIPPPLRGRRLLMLRYAYPGDRATGERLAAPLRAAAPIHLDHLTELPAAEIARVHNDPTEPGPTWVRGTLLTQIDQAFASALLQHAGAGTNGPFVAVEVRHVGEASHRDVEIGSAVGGRPARFTLAMIGVNPARFAEMPAAADRLAADVRDHVAPENNINFLGAPRSAADLARCWPAATFARLGEVRRRYDPDGVFAAVSTG